MSGFVRDPELCEKYAQFASHLVRWQFKIIYWTLFITNLFVLFLASWTYIRYVAHNRSTVSTPLFRFWVGEYRSNTNFIQGSRIDRKIWRCPQEEEKEAQALHLPVPIVRHGILDHYRHGGVFPAGVAVL